MNNIKRNANQMFGWLRSLWTNVHDDDCAEEYNKAEDVTYVTTIWNWECGTPAGELPFKYIPKTLIDIWRVKKKYSLISKIKTTYNMCVEPLLRRKIYWDSEFGSGHGKFYTFDWLTFKIEYSTSLWTASHFEEKRFFERYIWQKEFRKIKSRYLIHDIAGYEEVSEIAFAHACDDYAKECQEQWEAFDDN